ncbi:MAG: polymerase sigma factor RpoE [Polyangiaceae bacterium]|jgi:RNA polymerase sigma-70 factor (ECF subfamily)|nr:polymerase sigma factor RpoE [Polyangiaceae bacterium]
MSLAASTCAVVVAQDGGAAFGSTPVARARDFERVYDDHFENVGRWIRAFGGRSSDVADITQEVFIVAFRRLPEFDGQNFRGWLFQITRGKMRDYRRLKWVKHFFTERTKDTFESAAMGADQLALLENKEKQALLDRILRRLPTDHRVAFVLFELEGLTGAEIAEAQRVPINTVWARIHRARRKLQSFAARER